MLPEWFYLATIAIFGLIIGSFLNVVIYRFHTGKSLNDRSHCLSCAKTLRWYELVPVLSYVLLRGRCSNCQSYIPARYALVELFTAGLFVMAYLKLSDLVALCLLLTFLTLLVIGFVYDLYHMIIPDEVSWGGLLLAAGLVGYQAWVLSSWLPVWSGVIGAVIGGGFFFVLWFVSDGRWLGLGDAKLALSLGMLVGMGGVFSMLVFSFWIGAVIGLSVIVVQQSVFIRKLTGRVMRGRVKMKSEIPFAPFLIIAFMLVYFTDWRVLTLFMDLLQGLV